MKYLLEVDGLNKTFKGKKALDNVSFRIFEGCVTGFVGVNGAGKTTTIKSILGLNFPDSGEIKIFGKCLKDNEKEIKDRIGIVFDNGYLYEDLSIEEMKKIIAPAYSRWDENVFRSYLERFNLDKKQKIKTLSKGMKMKCALALALSHHADLLIMDEPTSGLDPKIRKQLLEIIKEFVSEDGKSAFFSTHITNDLEKTADQIIMLDQGKILIDEDKDVLLEKHALVKGDKSLLTHDCRKLFVSLEEKGFGFEGLTNNRAAVRNSMKDIIMEKPLIEDIMIAYAGR